MIYKIKYIIPREFKFFVQLFTRNVSKNLICKKKKEKSQKRNRERLDMTPIVTKTTEEIGRR